MTPTVVVVGLGGIGSAALAAIARRGCRAIGVDRFEPPHQRGGTHGGSRIIRAAYFEHPDYVPLARASLEAWRRVERETGERCLHANGVLLLGPPTSAILEACATSARLHGVPIETFGATEIVERWPMFEIPRDWEGVHEPDAGFVVPEVGVRAHLDLARRHGAKILTDTEVLGLDDDRDGVVVRLGEQVVRADTVVVAAGAWTRSLLPELSSAGLEPQRKAIVWSRPTVAWRDAVDARRMPAWLIDDEGASGDGAYYGVPPHADQVGPDGMKVGFHGAGPPVEPDGSGGRSEPDVVQRFHRDVSRYLPGVLENPHDSRRCLYTMSADRHFVIGRVPGRPSIVAASGFSGHGYKFAPVLGEGLAAIAVGDDPPAEFGFLSPDRFGEPRVSE
ncbi:MAG: N-methyl-L-tryptophan oxidase [Planctomycetota bacterium]|nr:N-methyl-L-tryptophan oxidase [Planctomycetota bacterium]